MVHIDQPNEVPVPPVRPNPRWRRKMIHQSVLTMEGQILALEGKYVLTEPQRKAVLWISKMLESMSGEFKAYHYDIVDALIQTKKRQEGKRCLTNTKGRSWSISIKGQNWSPAGYFISPVYKQPFSRQASGLAGRFCTRHQESSRNSRGWKACSNKLPSQDLNFWKESCKGLRGRSC